MQDRRGSSLRFEAGRLSVLDQRLLPQQECWHSCDSAEDLIGHIHSLAVRGAPLIGIAAVLMLAQQALQGLRGGALLQSWQALRAARPTAVNLMNYLDRIRPLIDADAGPAALCEAALAIYDEDSAMCRRLAEQGLPLLPDPARILTHCNTGSLATAGIGTALGLITHAHAAGRRIKVWVSETRPLLQGGRLTAWEMGRAGVPHSLICDSMAASLMREQQVDLVLVGADRIAANGDTANKIGTYALAVLARHHDIPFYVVAPRTTVDPQCPNGDAIPIEQRPADEVRGVSTAQGRLLWSPPDSPVHNPAFDVTPAALISAWVLDDGVHHAFSATPT